MTNGTTYTVHKSASVGRSECTLAQLIQSLRSIEEVPWRTLFKAFGFDLDRDYLLYPPGMTVTVPASLRGRIRANQFVTQPTFIKNVLDL